MRLYSETMRLLEVANCLERLKSGVDMPIVSGASPECRDFRPTAFSPIRRFGRPAKKRPHGSHNRTGVAP